MYIVNAFINIQWILDYRHIQNIGLKLFSQNKKKNIIWLIGEKFNKFDVINCTKFNHLFYI